MVQDFCDEPYDDMPYGTLLFLFYFDPLPLTLGTWSRSDPDVGDPGGVGVYVNRGESPGGASPWIWITHKKTTPEGWIC
jgi:hypothetical protein